MIYDLTIIGGGPAGAAAGVYAARKQLKTMFITKDWNSQSTVSEGIENWIGTIKLSGMELADSLEKHLRAYAGEFVDVHVGESCEKVEKKNGELSIITDKNTYQTKSVLISSGSHRRKLDVPGADRLEHKGLTYCASCDGPLFKDKDVVVVGGGNAAFESAAQLLAYCKSVTLVNRSEKFRADPGTIEAVSKNSHFKLLTNVVPKEVKGDRFVEGFVYTDKITSKDTELKVSGIFVEIGSIPTTSFVKDLVELDHYGHIKVDSKNQRTSVAGVWAAGDCTDGLYHQNNIAAGDAVKALEDIYLALRAK
ncbi:FAD-dependent oxidoreductase [Patescibacteria group bacterium]|nr:FAD-dependent oxidoreductase [Patescibacteria group bacterium]MDE1946576.1 FAD-dependent oxidoreductase [Patescibacteria group bacterium]MDE2010863.1 FAD-dependent oxidoreductase [Patescibacteria group bacterium]MDE2232747.1 FAD-dependent oxidoreductase [Patescibacteria group bacterium]